MSYGGFSRGRGFGLRGTRAKGPFGRPRFPHFRYAGPPRPGHPASFVPRQPNNFYQPQLPHGNLQFRPRGRGRRVYNYDDQFGLIRPPAPPACEEAVLPTLPPPPPPPQPQPQPQLSSSLTSSIQPLLSINLQIEDNQTEKISQPPLLGSKEERQQKITETADRLKQKLSSFSSDEMIDIWSDDISLPPDTIEDGCIENKGIPELRYEPPELNLTYNDLKDIGKINPNNTKLDTSHHATIFNVTSNTDNDVILDENENGCQIEVISSHQMPDLENLPDNNECIEADCHELVDNSHNLEQSDLLENINVENKLLESDLECHYNVSEENISQDQCNQQQNISQEVDIHLTSTINEQDVSKTQDLQNTSFLTVDSTDQDILQTNILQNEEEPIINSEVQETILSSHIYTENSSNNNSTLSQPSLANASVSNNAILDNHQLPGIQENLFSNKPPKLSPHTEQLPIDFDPSTPPPTLLKQEQLCTLPPFSKYDLPPLFDPTEPPPNMRHLVESKMPHENIPAWNINVENQVSVSFDNREMHTELNTHEGFQLPLEMPSQSNVFLPSHIDTINFSPFSMPPSNNLGIETNIPSSALPQMQQVPHNVYASSPEKLLFSDSNLHYNENKDDGLNDMQEAMMFAKQMTDLIEKKESNAASLSESCTLTKSINDIESIALPPGKPKTKLKRKRCDSNNKHNNKKLVIEEGGTSDYVSSEGTIVQEACLKSKDTLVIDEQDRPKVVFNLNNKIKKVNTKGTWPQDSITKCLKKNGMAQAVECNEKEESKTSKKGENNLENIIVSNLASQDVLSQKKIQKDVHRSPHSNVPSYQKVNVQKSLGSHIEKNDISNSESSWKNKIINRFLKMSKNEIYNMVNNTSLRKFDVLMNRLVKEQRPTLSLEMRQAQDEKMKSYDQQEFMKQLNAMLDPDAIVAITDLPTEFIHHLNEVLQLDVIPSNLAESTTTSIISNSPLESTTTTDPVLDPVMYTSEECESKTTSSIDVNKERLRKKNHKKTIEYEAHRDTQAHKNTQVHKDMQVRKDSQAHKDMPTHKDMQARKDTQAHKDMPIHKDTQAYKDTQTYKDTRIHKDTPPHKDMQAHKNTQAYKDTQAYKNMQAHKDMPAHKDIQTHKNMQAHKNVQAHKDTRIHKDTPPHKDMQAHKNTQAHKDTQSHKDMQIHRNTQVYKNMQSHKDVQIHKNTQSYKNMQIHKDTQAYKDMHMHKDTQAYKDMQAYKDTQAHKDIQAHNIKINDFNLKDDTCSTKSNKSSTSSRLSTLQHDLDDIFSEVTKKSQALIRKDCNVGQQSMNISNDAASLKNLHKETYLEDDEACRSENCERWIEKCDKWKRKEQEDPHAYRNLTKEEWEAKYGVQANSMPSSSTPKIVDDDNSAPNKTYTRNLYPRRRHSSESSKHSNTRHKTIENEKPKRSRRHSDERRDTAEYSDDSNSSTSSGSSNSSSNSSSNDRGEPNITKLLRVIKEKEKVAKKMSLSETIRDEVNAEIERERKQKSKKSHKNRKKSKRKEKKSRNRKSKKQKKKTSNPSNSSSQEDNDREEMTKLLTENEIKKEILENQIAQVLIKEELDISQDAEFTNTSNHQVIMENIATSLFSEPQDTLESLPLAEESAVDIVQSLPEDKPITTSPTQPKTKAQLKQMPETADVDDTKVSLNILSNVPEDWSTINPVNIAECSDNLNKYYQETDTSQEIPSINNFTSQNEIDNAVQMPCSVSKENITTTISQQQNTITCASIVPSANTKNIQGDNKILAFTDISSKMSTVVASASSVSSIPITNTVKQKQGASKKIDIKTYYERTIQRRINEQGESKKPANESITKTQDALSTPKIAEGQITINKFTSVTAAAYGSSVQDPRLASPARLAVTSCSTTSKDNITQITLEKDIRQDVIEQKTEGSEVAGSALKHSGEHPIDINSAAKKVSKSILENETLHTAGVNASNVVTMKTTKSKSKKRSETEGNVTDKTLQSKIPPDSKKFKNIRSEGSKELKLKKETIPKTKIKTTKKPVIASKSANLVSTKINNPKTTTDDTDKVTQEKETDNIDNTNKIEIEQIEQLINPCASKINNNNTEMEPIKISSENIDDNNSVSLQDSNKTKECSSKSELIKTKHIKESIKNTKSNGIREQLPSEKIQNEKVCNINRVNDRTSVESVNTENHNAKEISNVVPEFDVSTISEINPETKILDDIEETNKEDISSSLSEIEQSNSTKDTELSLNDANQTQVEQLNEQNLLESTNYPASIAERDVSGISERHSDTISQLDNINTQGKKNHLLTDTCEINNIEINDTNENHIEPDILRNTYKSASADEKRKTVLLKETIALSSVSNENSQEQQVAGAGGVISPDSAGSPFKGFLQEPIIAFEQPNLFNIALDEIDAGKKDTLLTDDCSTNCMTDINTCKEMNIEKQHNYETMESVTDYTNDMNISTTVDFNLTFDDALFASDKESAMNEKNDKSNLIADENREEEKSSSEIVTTTLHEDNDINAGEGIETEKQLISEEEYTSNIELAVKGSVFINEEEMIQDETRSKDFADKLTTTADPSLSDALVAATSDETLRLPEIQGAEHLDNHIYLETNISSDKISCDKLQGFDSDEHLDNDMFYLDDRLQSVSTFDNKDDTSEHFSEHREDLHYDITSAIIPETTTITSSCSDLSHVEIQKPEGHKFDFKHISSIDNDCNLFTGASIERSPTIIDTPRTLNIPTKAALKEASTNLYLKSPNNTSTAIEEDRILKKIQQSEADLSYQIPTWHLNVHNNETHTQKTQNNTMILTQDIDNVNMISSTQNGTNDIPSHKNVNIKQTVLLASSANTEHFHSTLRRTPVVELRKMKELDNMVEKKVQKNTKKTKNTKNIIYKDQKKRKDTILHKLKDKRQLKHRIGSYLPNAKSLSKKLKNIKQTGISGTTREAIIARMLEIDLEMHKLATEKLKLHEILQSNVLSAGNSVSDSNVSKTKENDTVPVQPEILPTSQLVQNVEISCVELDKHTSPMKQSLKQRKRSVSHSSEDDEVTHYTQKIKTPVIRWKKIPRLEQIVKRKDQENQDERIEQRIPSPVASKTADNSIDAAEDIAQKPEADAVTVHDAQVLETSAKTDNKKDCDVDKFSRRTIWSDKNADKQSESRESAETEADNTERLPVQQRESNINKKNDNLTVSEAAKVNSQSSSVQVHSTPEPLSIYSDDSTWDSLVQNTASEMHEKKKSTGLALLEETFKKELAISRKMKAVARKQKKKQLDIFLKSVNSLTVEEEELPLSKLYIRKLQQKRDLLDSLSQKKDDVINAPVDPKAVENMEKVINAVAENRVEALYEYQSEAQASNDNVITKTSNISSVSQSDKNEFYIDAETNANSDWPCREKENTEEIALQQRDNNNESDADGSNRAFTAVNENKVPLYDERNVEPDSSVTPEETLIDSHSPDCEELNNTALRNFDIKVSVPKTLIRDDFSLELLQKINDTDSSVVVTKLVDSTTNTEKLEKNEEQDRNSQDTLQIVESIAEKDKSEEKSEEKLLEKNKHTVDACSNERDTTTCELQKQETTDSVINAQSAPQSSAKAKYPDTTENENSGDSIVSNEYDKIATDIARDTSSSDSITENMNTEYGTKNLSQNVESAVAVEKEKNKPECKPCAFEGDQHTSNLVPADPADPVAEKSEESNEMSIEEGRNSENTSTSSILSFDKAVKNTEMSKKLINRKKQGKLTAVRRSSRYTNDNTKSKISEIDANSNSTTEQELNSQEKDLTTRRRSKSPVSTMRDEKIVNILNAKKNRVIQKTQNTSARKATVSAETELVNSVKSLTAIAEYAVSKIKPTLIGRKRKHHTTWQMTNCKVKLIDCKYTLLKPDVNPEVLRQFGIVAINPYVQRSTSCEQHTAVIPIAVLEESFLSSSKIDDKEIKPEIEILKDKPIKNNNDNDVAQESTSHVEIDEQESGKTQYTVHKGPILDIKIFENSFLAASEDGKIYRYSQTSNGILNIYQGHKAAVTCLHIYKLDVAGVNKELMYSGSLDGTLRCYNIRTGALIRTPAKITSPIQCMDEAWGLIFVGTKSGNVSRIHIKTGAIKGNGIHFSDQSVLALKATNEGPRKILIVASRHQPITIRDAQNGLFLRTISSQNNHTVYSLMRHNNLIYCGTSNTSINVFDFTTGNQVNQYYAGVGIVCMRLQGKLLFAGCYNGNIYVFDTTNHDLVCSIPGPGNMLLSLEVVYNKIIAGSKDRRLHSWQMPTQVRALLDKIT